MDSIEARMLAHVRALAIHHKQIAARHTRLSFCHEVLAGDEKAVEAANVLVRPRWGGDGMTEIDAALMAIREGHGDISQVSDVCAHNARRTVSTMQLASAARAAGLMLADIRTTYNDDAPDMTRSYLVALRDKPTARPGLHRMVLRMALDIGLVSPASHCMHEYDCCGHWYSSSPRVLWLDENLFELSQTTYQNV